MAAQTTNDDFGGSGLRAQAGLLFDALRGADGLHLGPAERMDAIALMAMLRLRFGETMGAADVEQLASALAAVLAKNERQRSIVAGAVRRIFSAAPRADADVEQTLNPPREVLPAAGSYPVKVAWPYRRKLAVLALICATAICGSVAWRYWTPEPPQEARRGGDFVVAPVSPRSAPAEAAVSRQSALIEPLTLDELKAAAGTIIAAGGGARDTTLWQLAGPLSRPGDPARDRMATYKLLTLHSALDTSKPVDLNDAATVERLLWAYLYVTQPSRTAAEDNVREAAKLSAATPKSNASAAASQLPRALDAYVAPWWLFWLSVGLPVLAIGVRGAGFSSRKRRHAERVLAKGPGREGLEVPAGQIDPAPLQTERTGLALAARHLHARAEIATPHLDVERTIDATMAQGGLFTPRLANLKVTPEYLVLIATQGPDDQEANRLSYIVEQFGRHDISLDRRYIEHDADRVFVEREERRVPLASVQATACEHRLIVLGSGEGFLDPATLDPKPWTEAFARWPVRAFATPVPFEEWGIREARLSGLFDGPLFRTTTRGLEAMALYLRDWADANADAVAYQTDTLRSWRFNSSRWMSEAPYMEDEAWSELWPELQSYLEVAPGDRRGIDWLAAVAIYPAIRWDLTAYLGLRLTATDRAGKRRALYDDEIASRLSVLPWFGVGRMPDWLRKRLIAEMPSARRREIIGLIGELLVAPRAAVAGAPRVRLPVAAKGTGSGETGAEPPRRPDDDLAANDRELLDLLEAERGADRLLEGKSPGWRGYFTGWGQSFRSQERTWGWLFLAYLACALWLAPKPWGGAASSGGWWSIALLGLGLVAVPLAAWLAKRAEAAVEAADWEAR
ncbi:MAG: hypothetical protein ABL901_09465 [Hyphomicrobiaceae bacterium]